MNTPVRVLLLAGTREARELAHALSAHEGVLTTASFAGATEMPADLQVKTRIGGFGGAEGLARYLTATGVHAVIDATHPFAEQMSMNAVAACKATDIPLLRLERKAWVAPDGAEWINVASGSEASENLPRGARVFLTVGSNSLEPFLHRRDVWFLVRTWDRQTTPLPLQHYEAVSGPPPKTANMDMELMRAHNVTHLVTKNSGGPAYNKLLAAAHLNIPALVIDRPKLPSAETVDDPSAALQWLQRFVGSV